MKRRRRGTSKVQGGDGRTGTPTSGRHSPPKAGGGKDPQFRGGPFSAGIPAFGVIRTLEWQTPFAALRAPCPRPVKADGSEPPATLRAAVPTGGRRSLAGAAREGLRPTLTGWSGPGLFLFFLFFERASLVFGQDVRHLPHGLLRTRDRYPSGPDLHPGGRPLRALFRWSAPGAATPWLADALPAPFPSGA